MTEGEMVGWYHQFYEHLFEQTPGDSQGQESLMRCSLWGHKESDMTYWLNKLKLRKPTEFLVISGTTETEADSTDHKGLEKLMQLSGITG